MQVRSILGALILGLALAGPVAGPAAAQSIRDDVEAALVAQGYEILHVGRTWLGRLRMVVENDDIRREIVINPTTGEVLRDYSVALTSLRRPLFPGDDRSPDRTREAPVASLATDGESTGAADEIVTGAEGALGAPPLTVDE